MRKVLRKKAINRLTNLTKQSKGIKIPVVNVKAMARKKAKTTRKKVKKHGMMARL